MCVCVFSKVSYISYVLANVCKKLSVVVLYFLGTKGTTRQFHFRKRFARGAQIDITERVRIVLRDSLVSSYRAIIRGARLLLRRRETSADFSEPRGYWKRESYPYFRSVYLTSTRRRNNAIVYFIFRVVVG